MSKLIDPLVIALVQYRERKTIPREAISRDTDISMSTIYRWEKGLSLPRGLTRQALLRFLKRRGVPVSDESR